MAKALVLDEVTLEDIVNRIPEEYTTQIIERLEYSHKKGFSYYKIQFKAELTNDEILDIVYKEQGSDMLEETLARGVTVEQVVKAIDSFSGEVTNLETFEAQQLVTYYAKKNVELATIIHDILKSHNKPCPPVELNTEDLKKCLVQPPSSYFYFYVQQ